MAPLNINLGNANPGTVNLGPTCITDWFVMDIPDPGELTSKTYLFVVSNPTVFAGVDINPYVEVLGGLEHDFVEIPTDNGMYRIPYAGLKRRLLTEGIFVYDLSTDFDPEGSPIPTLVKYIPALPQFLLPRPNQPILPIESKHEPVIRGNVQSMTGARVGDYINLYVACGYDGIAVIRIWDAGDESVRPENPQVLLNNIARTHDYQYGEHSFEADYVHPNYVFRDPDTGNAVDADLYDISCYTTLNGNVHLMVTGLSVGLYRTVQGTSAVRFGFLGRITINVSDPDQWGIIRDDKPMQTGVNLYPLDRSRRFKIIPPFDGGQTEFGLLAADDENCSIWDLRDTTSIVRPADAAPDPDALRMMRVAFPALEGFAEPYDASWGVDTLRSTAGNATMFLASYRSGFYRYGVVNLDGNTPNPDPHMIATWPYFQATPPPGQELTYHLALEGDDSALYDVVVYPEGDPPKIAVVADYYRGLRCVRIDAANLSEALITSTTASAPRDRTTRVKISGIRDSGGIMVHPNFLFAGDRYYGLRILTLSISPEYAVTFQEEAEIRTTGDSHKLEIRDYSTPEEATYAFVARKRSGVGVFKVTLGNDVAEPANIEYATRLDAENNPPNVGPVVENIRGIAVVDCVFSTGTFPYLLFAGFDEIADPKEKGSRGGRLYMLRASDVADGTEFELGAMQLTYSGVPPPPTGSYFDIPPEELQNITDLCARSFVHPDTELPFIEIVLGCGRNGIKVGRIHLAGSDPAGRLQASLGELASYATVDRVEKVWMPTPISGGLANDVYVGDGFFGALKFNLAPDSMYPSEGLNPDFDYFQTGGQTKGIIATEWPVEGSSVPTQKTVVCTRNMRTTYNSVILELPDGIPPNALAPGERVNYVQYMNTNPTAARNCWSEPRTGDRLRFTARCTRRDYYNDLLMGVSWGPDQDFELIHNLAGGPVLLGSDHGTGERYLTAMLCYALDEFGIMLEFFEPEIQLDPDDPINEHLTPDALLPIKAFILTPGHALDLRYKTKEFTTKDGGGMPDGRPRKELVIFVADGRNELTVVGPFYTYNLIG